MARCALTGLAIHREHSLSAMPSKKTPRTDYLNSLGLKSDGLLDGLPVPGGGHRCLQPQSRGLVHGRADDRRTGAGGVEHGPAHQTTRDGHPPLRPGQPAPASLGAELPVVINFERKHIEHEDSTQEHGLPTASVGSSQAPTAAVDNPAPVQSSA